MTDWCDTRCLESFEFALRQGILTVNKRCNILTLIVAENIRIVGGQVGRECQVFVAFPAT